MAQQLLMLSRRIGDPRERREIISTDDLPERLAPFKDLFEMDEFFAVHIYVGPVTMKVLSGQAQETPSPKPGQNMREWQLDNEIAVRRNMTAAIIKRGG